MDYSALRHLGTCNLTWKSPKIFTRWPQTPDKGTGTICGMCYTQEVFDGFDFKGKIEGTIKCGSELSLINKKTWKFINRFGLNILYQLL